MVPFSARAVLTCAALSMVATGCAGCSSDSGAGSGDGGGDGGVQVIASTNVWGSVVQAVGGDAVSVRTLIDEPGADPHSYESTPADAAEVGNADLVVFNGGGYDEFMTQILQTAGSDKPTVETFTLLAQQPAEEERANEHVWYDLETVQAVADNIADRLAELRPDQAQSFTSNANGFNQRIDELAATIAQIGQRKPGVAVALTEPLAVYLVDDAGLRDATPPEFIEAVEEETDPPAAAVNTTHQLVTSRQITALIYNPQTEIPVTQQIRIAAEQAGVPVVEMTETLPPATDYLTWISSQIQALSNAVPSR